MNQKFEKWNKWLDIIHSEITNLSIYKNIFWEVQAIIKNNPKIQKPSSFYEFLGSSYIALIIMGIRRQIKIDKDSISFAKLLNEISINPEFITRKHFVDIYKENLDELTANEEFNDFAGGCIDHVDPQLVKKDLEELTCKGNLLEAYADKIIAHHDKKSPKSLPTFDDVNKYIELLEELMKKYYLLFRAKSLMSILPTYQYDWKSIFREKWIIN